jgi:hypothetical protein
MYSKSLPGDLELAHPSPQRVGIDAEQTRRAVRAFDPAASFVQRTLDVASHHRFERLD